MPPFTVGAFRTAFPEFKDKRTYTDQTINEWASLAQAMVSQCRWKSQWLMGVHLYVAHEITLAAQNVKVAAAGGAPGTFGGVANNKTVGQATVAYDSQANSEKDAGYWNLTNYGKKFYRLARIFGAGAIQL